MNACKFTCLQAVRNAQQGWESTIGRKKRVTPPIASKVAGEVEAKIIASGCSKPPGGRSRWILELLADRAVELKILDSISHETVRQILKNELKPYLGKCWFIPPEQNAAFVAAMEDVFDVYKQLYNQTVR